MFDTFISWLNINRHKIYMYRTVDRKRNFLKLIKHKVIPNTTHYLFFNLICEAC